MSRSLRLVFACVALAAAGSARAEAGIYMCVDAKGHKLTSDRPIQECADREQKELNPSGSLRRVVPPAMSDIEFAREQERQHKAAEDRQRESDLRRLQRQLVARYPQQAAHDAERARALQSVEDTVASAQKRISDLQAERRHIDEQAQGYKSPTAWPEGLKRQAQENDQQMEAQRRFIAGQQAEKARINAQFDQELATLRQLWQRNAPAAAMAESQASH
jgi:hypothetical protein